MFLFCHECVQVHFFCLNRHRGLILFLQGILDAPMPVFVGLRQPYVDPRLYERTDTVVVDLDSGRIHISGGDSSLFPLPATLSSTLRSELEEYGGISNVAKLTKDELDGLDLTFPMVPTDVRISKLSLRYH